MYLTRKCLIEIKNLLYKRVLAKDYELLFSMKIEVLFSMKTEVSGSIRKTSTFKMNISWMDAQQRPKITQIIITCEQTLCKV